MCVCVCVCVCVRACVRACARAQYAAVPFRVCSVSDCICHVCAQIRVWSRVCLFTEITVCKLLRGLAVVWPVKPFYFILYMFRL